MSYIIRQAILDDIPSICKELKEFSVNYTTKLPPYKDDETSARILENIIQNHLFYVALKSDDHSLVGFIAGYVCDNIYNPDIKVLAEAFWWTSKWHRRSGIGLRLLEYFETWGKNNVDWIVMTVENDTPISDEIFLNRGFRLKETSFILEVN